MIDVMSLIPGDVHPLDEHSLVRIVDIMPRILLDDDSEKMRSIVCDQAIVQAARVSYGSGMKTLSEDIGLIRYLYRHSHTTPFEMVEFKFHFKMPIFVARQFIRHRTANVNEISGRYSVLPDNFYIPTNDNVRGQATGNKQGSDKGLIGDALTNSFIEQLEAKCNEMYDLYGKFLDAGIGREQARMILPLNIYTEWYWKIDLHNLLHFLKLRCDTHAQWEIRVFADAMLDIVKITNPISVQAWEDYNDYRGAIKLSRLECLKLKEILDFDEGEISEYVLNCGNKREDEEWITKLKRILS